MFPSNKLTLSWLVIILTGMMLFQGIWTASRDRPYYHDAEFKRMVQDVLLELKDDDIHSRIMAVNDVHKKYQQQIQRDLAEKNQSIDIDIDEDIIETNLEQGVNLFEGDIDLSPEQYEMIHETGTLQRRTAARQSKSSLWHDRMIPYMIAPSLRSKRNLIKEAVRIFQRDTCLRFYEMSSHRSNTNYIYFDMRDGCHSKIGKAYRKTKQLLSLGSGCHNVGTILHEMTHAIGFWHEQSRTDRNKYVKVLWENIISGQENNFERHETGYVESFNLPYDFESIMHYGKKTFSKNGGNTLERVGNPQGKLGRSGKEFSDYDKTAINALYECNKYPANYQGFTSWSKWIGCNWNCKRYRERFCMGITNPYWREKKCPGANQYGVHIEYKDCHSSECGPINGGWSNWFGWSYCNAKCGQGTRTRKRECTNPTPMRKGKDCPGSEKETVKCNAGKCKLSYYETQFEGNTGSWKSEGPGYYKWRVEGYYRNPGPMGDHTTGRGKWLYLPTSYSARYKGQKAKLVNTFGWGNPFCLTFYYSMDGPSVGSLSVVVKIKMRNDKRSWKVFTASGSKGRDWHRGVAFINVKDKNFQISFEGSGNGFDKQGVIALDDIYTSSTCPSQPTVKPTVPPCIDINLKCEQWAYKGECARRPKYMKKFCRKSCFCKPVKCVDTPKYKAKCRGWARKDECNKNSGWMWKNCCVSCRNAAKPTAPPCIDTNRKCEQWAYKGECSKRPKYMEKNCRKSCICKPVKCVDTPKYKVKCRGWAYKDECDKNSGWMWKNCCVSCRNAKICTDKYSNKKKCQNWAKTGNCKKYSSWMKKNCCRSCQVYNAGASL